MCRAHKNWAHLHNSIENQRRQTGLVSSVSMPEFNKTQKTTSLGKLMGFLKVLNGC